jgi:hypothetical protein
MHLALHRLWEDDDGMLQLQLRAQSGERALSQDFYAYPEDLRQFGATLEAFPSSAKDSAVFEYGSGDPKVYCWVRLRAYLYDSAGHSALEVMVENNLEPPAQASAQFSVKLEAATLNKLGQELVAWSRSKERDFEFEAREA